MTDPAQPSDAQRTASRAHDLLTAYVDAGFTRAEALQLVTTTLAGNPSLRPMPTAVGPVSSPPQP